MQQLHPMTDMEMKEKKAHWWHSNYSLGEKIDFVRYRIGAPKAEPYCTLPDQMVLHDVVLHDVPPTYSIAFVGDLMPIGDLRLEVSPGLRRFVGSADTLVVNLEGIVTDQHRLLALTHSPHILDAVRSLTDREVLINVANNHASDFGSAEYRTEVEQLRHYGFGVVGVDQHPYMIGEKYAVGASSLWSNQPIHTSERFTLQEVVSPMVDTRCVYTIFLPHWGYEMELHPRAEQVEYAQQMLSVGWDSIIGNHPHCPQPVQIMDEHIVAYSLGNFCYKNANPNHWYGMALKLSFSDTTPKPLLCRVQRLYTLQQLEGDRVVVTDTDELDFARIRQGIRPGWNYLSDLLK